MTRDVASVAPGAPYREIVDVLINCGVSALPVVDTDGLVVGVVSEADLLHKQTVADGAAAAAERSADRRRGWGRRGRRLLGVAIRRPAAHAA
jgi:CBS domain-containing protein